MNWLSYEGTEEMSDALIREYLSEQAERFMYVDIEGFAQSFLHLPIVYCSFTNKDEIGFISDGVTELNISQNCCNQSRVFPKGTIVIEVALTAQNEAGRRRFTISHEAAHYIIDKTLAHASYHREFDKEQNYTFDEFKRLFCCDETYIDRLASSLIMPRFMIVKYLKGKKLALYGNDLLVPADKLFIKSMAGKMGVSYTALLIRLKQLNAFIKKDTSEYIKLIGFGKAQK